MPVKHARQLARYPLRRPVYDVDPDPALGIPPLIAGLPEPVVDLRWRIWRGKPGRDLPPHRHRHLGGRVDIQIDVRAITAEPNGPRPRPGHRLHPRIVRERLRHP